jgi:hypothetical protein
MNMSVTQFTVAPAMVGRSRSVWRAGDRGVGDERQALARAVVDHDEDDLGCFGMRSRNG